MKILFIFTGGTIGSTKQGDYISTDKTKPYSIIHSYDKKYKIDFDYDVVEPYSILSENATGNQLKLLYDCVIQNFKSGYDGLIITHGTDTLQYSASAIAYGVGNNTIPIIFVSSNYPIENPLSNGIDNLKGGIEFIKKQCGKGVFVSYKNKGEPVKIFRASRLVFSRALNDKVDCLKDDVYGQFDNLYNFIKSPLYVEKPDELEPLSLDNLTQFSSEILWLNGYTGMPYPKLDSTIKYILITTYHSGTINASSKAQDFLAQANKKGIKIIICPVTHGAAYESTSIYSNYNVTLAYNISPISAYVKLWILSSLNKEQSLINCSLAGDVVD